MGDFEELFEYGFETEFTEGMALFYALYVGFMCLLSLGMYILLSFGLYTAAQRRGISKPWLAWIPVGQSWILGCLSDQYQRIVRGRNTGKRKSLLTLSLLTGVFAVLMIVVFVAITVLTMGGSENLPTVTLLSLAATLLYLAILGVTVAYMIIHFMALYDYYRGGNPNNATVFLVLSIFFSVTMPFFVFALRNKDDGFAPPQPVYQQPYYQPQAYQPNAYQPPVQQNGWQQPQQDGWQPPVQQNNGWQPPVQHNGWQPPQQNSWQQPPQNPPVQEPWENQKEQD